MPAAPPLDVRLYRAALRLYPAAFKHEFLDQIAQDFADARADTTSQSGAAALGRFWWQMFTDLARSIAIQWLRTGWPLIATAALAASWLQFTAVASFWWQSVFPVRMRNDGEGAVMILMLLTVIFVVMAVTITTTIWIGRSIRRPRRR